MAVRSRRLFPSTTAVQFAYTDLFTVPQGRTAIYRSIFLANSGALPAVMVIFSGPGPNNAVWIGTIPGGSTIVVPGVVIGDPGHTLTAQTAANGPVSVTGFGSLLNGAPL